MTGELENWFPKLRQRGYEVTSPRTPKYNCIAWAAKNAERWWWPDPIGVSFWPGGRRLQTIEAFVDVFAALGYTPCDSAHLDVGHEKVALYAKDSEPTHMARQLPTGEWTSKCGKYEDIIHRLSDLEGDCYGTVVLIMRRPLVGGSNY